MSDELPCSDEMMMKICDLLAEGKSVNTISEIPGMPGTSTVYRWLKKSSKFRDMYFIAKGEGCHAIAEEAMRIADDGTNDYVMSEDGDGAAAYRVMGENIHRSRLRVDTRKWYVSKLAPKFYGDSIRQDVVQHNINTNFSIDADADPQAAAQAYQDFVKGL